LCARRRRRFSLFVGACGDISATSSLARSHARSQCRGKAPSEIITTQVSIDDGAATTVQQKFGTHALYVVEGTKLSTTSYMTAGNVRLDVDDCHHRRHHHHHHHRRRRRRRRLRVRTFVCLLVFGDCGDSYG